MGEATAKDLTYLQWCVNGAALFSTCGRAQYMAILTDRFGHVVSTGYNGGPKGMPHCKDGACPRLSRGTGKHPLYDDCIGIHAEANAYLHADYSQYAQRSNLYVNGVPCLGCAKLIANSGTDRLVYLERPEQRDDEWRSLEFMEECAVELVAVASLGALA